MPSRKRSSIPPLAAPMTRGKFLGALGGSLAALALGPRLGGIARADTPESPQSPAAAAPIDCFRPGQPWLDTDGVPINAHGAGLLHDGDRYFWYGEFKVGGDAGNSAQVGISCYSSTDLYNWKNEGIVLPVTAEPGSDLERGCILERPKVLRNAANGTFVLWCHYERKGHGYDSAQVAIAVADNPRGPFRLRRILRPNGEMSRDMTLFLDEEGTAWHVRSSEGNATMQLARLTPDYLDCEPDVVRIMEHSYPEAPALIFHDGWYHMIASHCSGWAPNPARRAVAQSVAGPWKELGNPAVGDKSDITFNSQSTFLLKPAGTDVVIYLGDRWQPKNPIDGTYIWLPLELSGTDAALRWRDSWRLSDVVT
ncbi:MAG: glycoside hydrolase family 43 protein [Verrucomicrobiota bacterium]